VRFIGYSSILLQKPAFHPLNPIKPGACQTLTDIPPLAVITSFRIIRVRRLSEKPLRQLLLLQSTKSPYPSHPTKRMFGGGLSNLENKTTRLEKKIAMDQAAEIADP
jgi:hypothetical protein